MNYDDLPVSLRGGVQRYIENGIEPGGFLRAVICNDLRESFGRADIHNRVAMFEIVSWFHNEAPEPCWGSPEQYEAWREKHRMDRAHAAASVLADDGRDR